jgi:hypothetical protein
MKRLLAMIMYTISLGISVLTLVKTTESRTTGVAR